MTGRHAAHVDAAAQQKRSGFRHAIDVKIMPLQLVGDDGERRALPAARPARQDNAVNGSLRHTRFLLTRRTRTSRLPCERLYCRPRSLAIFAEGTCRFTRPT